MTTPGATSPRRLRPFAISFSAASPFDTTQGAGPAVILPIGEQIVRAEGL
jgi:hypothetical protein